jgi:DNA-binding XRE family transcriptional regulator
LLFKTELAIVLKTDYSMQKDVFLKKFGNHLRKLRNERKLTQADLADLIDKDWRSYQRIETGVTNTSIWYLQNIAQALNISLKELMDVDSK